MKIKFYAYDFANDNIGYHAIGPNENVSGEYVPLAEYQKLKAQYQELADDSAEGIKSLVSQRYQLQMLIRRVIDSGIYDKSNLESDLREAL